MKVIARYGVPGAPEYTDLVSNLCGPMMPTATPLVIYAAARAGGYRCHAGWIQPRQPDPNP